PAVDAHAVEGVLEGLLGDDDGHGLAAGREEVDDVAVDQSDGHQDAAALDELQQHVLGQHVQDAGGGDDAAHDAGYHEGDQQTGHAGNAAAVEHRVHNVHAGRQCEAVGRIVH
ncbi:hypothetical protein BBBGCB_BBBGCB_11820, partial [Dysosmobacter welbionis]